MADNRRVNIYRIETCETIEGVDTIETFHLAATSIRQALNFFDDYYAGKHVISIREIELEVGSFYDL